MPSFVLFSMNCNLLNTINWGILSWSQEQINSLWIHSKRLSLWTHSKRLSSKYLNIVLSLKSTCLYVCVQTLFIWSCYHIRIPSINLETWFASWTLKQLWLLSKTESHLLTVITFATLRRDIRMLCLLVPRFEIQTPDTRKTMFLVDF